MILVPLFYLMFLTRIRRLWCGNFKSAALDAFRSIILTLHNQFSEKARSGHGFVTF